MEPLLNSFMTFGSHLDPNKESYYTNIIGFIRGEVKFHNITPSFLSNISSNPMWRPFAEDIMNGTNTTEVEQRASTWNWTASDKVAMSVVEKNTEDRSFNLTEQIMVVHVRNTLYFRVWCDCLRAFGTGPYRAPEHEEL